MRFTTAGQAKTAQDDSDAQQAVIMPHVVVNDDVMADQHRVVIKKRVITAVVALLMTVIVVSGVLATIGLFTEHNKTTLQYTLKLLENNKFMGNEEVISDAADKTVLYHVTRNESQWWILDDFNKGLKVTKLQEGQGHFKCLVSVLQAKDAVKPSEISQPTELVNRNEDNAVDGIEVTRVASQAVQDRSFLGNAARLLCAGAPVHWTYKESLGDILDASSSSSPSSYSTNSGRSKRQAEKCFWCMCGYKFCFPAGSCGDVAAVFRVVGGRLQCDIIVGGESSGCPPARNIISAYDCPK